MGKEQSPRSQPSPVEGSDVAASPRWTPLARPAGWLLALIVSALVIPAITKQWTDYPKAQDLKRSVIGGIGEASAVAVEEATGPATASPALDVKAAWEKSAASLEAEVVTYFPDQRAAWDRYRAAVDAFLALPAAGRTSEQARRLVQQEDELLTAIHRADVDGFDDVPYDVWKHIWPVLLLAVPLMVLAGWSMLARRTP